MNIVLSEILVFPRTSTGAIPVAVNFKGDLFGREVIVTDESLTLETATDWLRKAFSSVDGGLRARAINTALMRGASRGAGRMFYWSESNNTLVDLTKIHRAHAINAMRKMMNSYLAELDEVIKQKGNPDDVLSCISHTGTQIKLLMSSNAE